MAEPFVSCAELRKIACEELNEVESSILEYIATLRAWIEKQPHLNARTDDRFLLAFLRGSKYSLEKAKSKIDYFYTMKSMMPDIFANNHMNEKNCAICRSGIYVRLPKPLGVAGPRIHLTICANLILEKFTLSDLFRYERMILEAQVFNDDNCIIGGYIEIFDVANVNIKFLSNFDIILLKKLSVFAEKATPMRLKGVHLINCPKEAYVLLNLFKNLMSVKLQARLHVHKSLDEFYKVIPRIYLPKEYGGENGSIPVIQAEEEQFLMSYDFKNDEQYGVIEKNRIGKQINQGELFGIEGSFRKLNVD